jgi:hypothetical protein
MDVELISDLTIGFMDEEDEEDEEDNENKEDE